MGELIFIVLPINAIALVLGYLYLWFEAIRDVILAFKSVRSMIIASHQTKRKINVNCRETERLKLSIKALERN